MPSWEDRIREAAYESPSGQRITLAYEDVSQVIDKKTTSFNFPDADGTYVQDLGHSGRRYPLRLFFWGENYDVESDAFEALILERGIGKLEHPIYGIRNVVPFGTITRNDELKTAANQAIIEVTFWETLELLYPLSQNDPAFDVLDSVEEYNEAIAEEFNEVTSLAKAIEQSNFKQTYDNFLNEVEKGLKPIADFQKDVRQAFDVIVDSIDQGIDVLIDQPVTLALQTLALIQAPARALGNIKARLKAYINLIDSIIFGDNGEVSSQEYSGEVATQGYNTNNVNDFFTKKLFISTYVTGQIVAVINNQFETKKEALEAAEVILEQLDKVVAWQDANLESLEEIDTGASYQQLQEAVALVVRYLVEISFILKQERRIMLDRNRTVIDLVGELYGEIDEQLDFFINSNNLSGSEIPNYLHQKVH